MVEESAYFSPEADHKHTPGDVPAETRAYRSNLGAISIPELAGDTVVFSATNPAGPVNPYELCASPRIIAHEKTDGSRRPLLEMLGDLHFPAELASINPKSPSDNPPRSPAKSDQIRMNRVSHDQLRNRTMSDTVPIVHRRPVPTNAFSDSMLTMHEIPPSLVQQNTLLRVPSAERTSETHSLATETPLYGLHQPSNSRRPSSYTAHQSHWGTQTRTPYPNRHLSAPSAAPDAHIGYADAYSAESTGSWGLDTQPTGPRAPRAQKSATATRMQSQKQMMDLLGSLGT